MSNNSAPHLSAQDRPEFERVLDDALRTVIHETAAGRAALTAVQLRAMAVSACAAICACAATEYAYFLAVRERQRASWQAGRAAGPGPGGRAADAAGADDASRGADDASGGAGALAMAGVLTPILAGAAALVFLLLGYLLGALAPPPAVAAPLRTAGWVFAAIALAGMLAAMAGLVLTAVRNGSRAIRAGEGARPTELDLARAAWLAALRDRGVLPFLREALAGTSAPGGGGDGAREHPVARGGDHLREPDASRLPHLGYSHPGFSSPGSAEPESDRPRFGSPGFTRPGFSSPDGPSDAESH